VRRLVALLAAAVIALALSINPVPDPACASDAGRVLALIRDARGDSILTAPALTAEAWSRALEITTDYSHAGADGRWAEILAWNSYPEDVTEAAAVRAWLDSPGHRAILLDGAYTHLGVGAVDVGHKHYYAVVFGTAPTTAPAKQPVRPRATIPPSDTECART